MLIWITLLCSSIVSVKGYHWLLPALEGWVPGSFAVIKTGDQCPGGGYSWDEVSVGLPDAAQNIVTFSVKGHRSWDIMQINRSTGNPYYTICILTRGEIQGDSPVFKNSNDSSREDEEFSPGLTPHPLTIQRNPESGGFQWPSGQYCLLKVLHHDCPQALKEGIIHLEFPLKLQPSQSHYPHITTSGHNTGTDIGFCCNNNGSSDKAIKLPQTNYWSLFSTNGIQCQKVKGMHCGRRGIEIKSLGSYQFRTGYIRGNKTRQNKVREMASFDVYDNHRQVILYVCVCHNNGVTEVLVTIGGISLVCLLIAILIPWSCHNHLKKVKIKYPIWKYLPGFYGNQYSNDNHDNQTMEEEPEQISEQDDLLGPLLVSALETDILAHVEKLLVSRKTIQIQNQIGNGAFGCVFRARYQPNPDPMSTRLIAVKMIKETCTMEDIALIIGEAMLMARVSHLNVLSLLGVSVEGEFGLPMLLLPLMENGDLHSYLRRFRYDVECKEMTPGTQEMLAFGYQVARGMEYLADQRIVHRDLATRNCMLSDTLVVKVADFGLARAMYSCNYHRQCKDIRLPVKWMALESLQDRVFTTYSDVWAYGVTLWEILSLARTPYPSLDHGDVFEYVRKGKRLEQPEACPQEIYQTMVSCWNVSPALRPSFCQLVQTIEEYITSAFGYLEIESDPKTSLMT